MKDLLLKLGGRIAVPLFARSSNGLDPDTAGVIRLQKLLRLPDLHTMDPPRARKFSETGLGSLDLDRTPMAKIVDTTVPGPAGRIPVRIYEPHDVGPDWIVYIHGGGGVIGSIESLDAVTRYLADRTKRKVASIEYRLAPEAKHPAAIEDCCAAWDAIAARAGAAAKIAVAGDSMGGFLSAHVDLYSIAQRKRRPDLQVLIYPLVDLELVSPSIVRLGEGYLLTEKMIRYFQGHYVRPTDDLRAGSPRYRPLAGSAPAIVVTAGFDPLVDEGDAYVEQLRAAGAKVLHRRFDKLVHGFISMGGAVPAARAALDQICDDIRRWPESRSS